MNEEIIEEIYNKLVERFGISKIFLPKYGKTRLVSITWKEFIKAAIELDAKELYTYCGYKDSSNFCKALNTKYKDILRDKNGRHWSQYLTLFVHKKICSICNSILGTSSFTKDNRQSDKLSTRCVLCTKIIRSYSLVTNSTTEMSYRITHRAEINARNAKRRATKLNATPPWADLNKIKQIYKDCPIGYHVDHIVPLNSKLVWSSL